MLASKFSSAASLPLSDFRELKRVRSWLPGILWWLDLLSSPIKPPPDQQQGCFIFFSLACYPREHTIIDALEFIYTHCILWWEYYYAIACYCISLSTSKFSNFTLFQDDVGYRIQKTINVLFHISGHTICLHSLTWASHMAMPEINKARKRRDEEGKDSSPGYLFDPLQVPLMCHFTPW